MNTQTVILSLVGVVTLFASMIGGAYIKFKSEQRQWQSR